MNIAKKRTLLLPLCLFFTVIVNSQNLNAQIVNPDNLQIVDINQHFGSSIIHHSILDIEQGMIKTAAAKLTDAIKKYPNSPANDLAVLLKANTDLQNGNNYVAVKTLQVFIATRNNSPFIPSAYLFSGYIELEAKNYENAVTNFKQANIAAQNDKIVRSDKEHYEDISHSANYWTAISLSKQGKYIEAIPYFDSTHKNHPHKQYAAQAILLSVQSQKWIKIMKSNQVLRANSK